MRETAPAMPPAARCFTLSAVNVSHIDDLETEISTSLVAPLVFTMATSGNHHKIYMTYISQEKNSYVFT